MKNSPLLSEIRWMENISLAPTGSLGSCHVSYTRWAQSESPLSKPDPFQMWAAELVRVIGKPLPPRVSCTSQWKPRGIFQSPYAKMWVGKRKQLYSEYKDLGKEHSPVAFCQHSLQDPWEMPKESMLELTGERQRRCVLYHCIAGYRSAASCY